MSLTDYPCQRDWPAFYGESLSLVQCLVKRKTPQAFVDFIGIALEKDYTSGLREVYNINGVFELQQIWSQYVSQADAQLAIAPGVARNVSPRDIKDSNK